MKNKSITFKEYKEYYKNKTIYTIEDKLKEDGILFYLDDIDYFYKEIKKEVLNKIICIIKEEMEDEK